MQPLLDLQQKASKILQFIVKLGQKYNFKVVYKYD